MLFSLHVENVALLRSLDLDLSGGLTVFTGETGAGKSILIDSIALLCGARTDRSIIRTGEAYAAAEGFFGALTEDAVAALAGIGIEPDGDGSLLLSRRITADGRSTARINGRSVPTGLLRSAASLLIDIHGQQDTMKLADVSAHLGMLDTFARDEEEKSAYSRVYSDYISLKSELRRLEESESDRAERLDMLAYRLHEIESAHITEGEEEELTAKRSLLANRERIISGCGEAYSRLYGADISAVSLADSALREVRSLADAVPECALLAERLDSARIELADIAESLYSYTDPGEGDPAAALDRVESRLQLINSLKRKYRTDEKGLLAIAEEAGREISGIQNGDSRRAEIKKELEKKEAELSSAASRLSERRRTAAADLEKRIRDELKDLDMPSVSFVAGFTEKPFSSDGADAVEFLVSANAGEIPRPVARIASGGELSRIMLAVKSVLSGSAVGTMIFDEIDTGISGATSARIGKKLASLASDGEQVFCVTHSAQIAAFAGTHMLIAKRESGGRTETTVTNLNREGRINELARIIGGISPGAAALSAAEALLDSSKQ